MLVASVISIATDCDHDSPQALLGLDQAMRIGRLLHWKNHIDDRSDLSVFNHLFERLQLLSRFPSCDLSNAITVIVEQKQRMVADRREVPVVGAAFLLPMHRALAGIHVEHDAVGSVERLRLSDQVAVHRHQPIEVVITGQ